jgi:hypothetical protein
VRSDFRFSPLIDAAIAYPLGRQQIFVGGHIGRDIYARNDQLNRNRYGIGGGVNLRAGSSCTGTLAADFRSRQVLVSELAELVPNAQETLQYGATAGCQTATGLGFNGTIRRIETSNDALSRQPFDVNSTIFIPQISYGRPNLGQFTLSGSYNEARYPRRSVLLPDGNQIDDGVNILNAQLGYSRKLGSRLSVQAGVSYLQAKPQPKTIAQIVAVVPNPQTVPPTPPVLTSVPVTRSTFSGIGFSAEVDYTPSPRLVVSLNLGRDVQASANVGAQYQVVQNYGLGIDYKLGAAITVGTGATYSQRDYRGTFVTIDEPLLRIQDKISRVYGRVNYQPVKLYSIGAELAYQNRESNPDAFSFDNFSALLTLRVHLGRES